MPVVAKDTVRVADHRDMIVKGRVYRDDDPLVKAHRDLFDVPEVAARRQQPAVSTRDLGFRSMSARGVEQATAAPGEVRSVGHPCPVDGCDFNARSRAGLARHSTTHNHVA